MRNGSTFVHFKTSALGSSLEVLWLRLRFHCRGAQVRSLVRDLRSRTLYRTPKKTPKKPACDSQVGQHSGLRAHRTHPALREPRASRDWLWTDAQMSHTHTQLSRLEIHMQIYIFILWGKT